jgi:hypothetical protein
MQHELETDYYTLQRYESIDWYIVSNVSEELVASIIKRARSIYNQSAGCYPTSLQC